MNLEVQDLAARVQQLEVQNKRMKRFGMVATGLCAVLALAAAAPVVCDVVSGERLVLRDASGRQRLVLDAYTNDGAPTLSVQSREGRTLAKLSLDDKGEACMALYDASGTLKSTLRSGGTCSGETKTDAAKTDASGKVVMK